MRAGFDTTLARVVKVFGAAYPHHAYLFTNRRANRLKWLTEEIPLAYRCFRTHPHLVEKCRI